MKTGRTRSVIYVIDDGRLITRLILLLLCFKWANILRNLKWGPTLHGLASFTHIISQKHTGNRALSLIHLDQSLNRAAVWLVRILLLLTCFSVIAAFTAAQTNHTEEEKGPWYVPTSIQRPMGGLGKQTVRMQWSLFSATVFTPASFCWTAPEFLLLCENDTLVHQQRPETWSSLHHLLHTAGQIHLP